MQIDIPLATMRVDPAVLASANRQVLWGWKRDVGDLFRVVYFAGTLEVSGSKIALGYRYFFYRHRLAAGEAEHLRDAMASSRRFAELRPRFSLTRAPKAGLADLVVSFGKPRAADLDRSTRLQRRRPRRTW